ncbi:MAG: hypothetical protein CMJ18_26805 [Phycisphaeraceae bacterium]|nr:hypothetical protein [Phycisphaeraceae bacterium]
MPLADGSGLPATDLVGTLGRRGHYRVECDLGVEFSIDAAGQSGHARAVNIGLGGTRIDFPVEIIIPAEVALQITFPGVTGPICLNGRVVWTVTDRINGPYPTGLQFQELADADRRRLYDLLTGLSG